MPALKQWYSVETPSVFKEILLPVNDEDLSDNDMKSLTELEDLAERHGTTIHASSYRRG